MNDSGQEQASRAVGPRDLPSVDRLLLHPVAAALCESGGRAALVTALREILAGLRTRLMAGEAGPQDISGEAILAQAATTLAREQRARLRPLINATGIAVHTNLGRAPLAAEAVAAVTAIAGAYSNLEFDLDSGRRGSRNAGVEAMLCALTGCEAALVVNNCAAAVMLALAAIAPGKEVILSRGELIEIGGSFRVPEVMEAAGVRLREVGTTNRTHLRDYEAAIGPDTGLLLKVHCSNFAIKGFTKEVELPELVALGRRAKLPVMVDLGSGLLLDLERAGVDLRSYDGSPVREPSVPDVIKTGVDLVTWSGDKMLGGPQGGIVLGNKEWVERAARHPIARAVRADKLTVAALEATLQCYAEGQQQVLAEIPVWQKMTESLEILAQRAQDLVTAVQNASSLRLQIREGQATVGGGAVPHTFLPSVRVAVSHPSLSTVTLEARLRARSVPIVGLLEGDLLMLDMRTLAPHEDAEVAEGLLAVCDEDA